MEDTVISNNTTRHIQERVSNDEWVARACTYAGAYLHNTCMCVCVCVRACARVCVRVNVVVCTGIPVWMLPPMLQVPPTAHRRLRSFLRDPPPQAT